MAVKPVTVQKDAGGGTTRITWPNLGNGDTGAPVEWPGAADRSVQVIVNAAGVGDTVVIEGSCEATPTNYSTLTEPGGAALSFNGAALEGVLQVTSHIRPNVTAGDGTTDLTVILLARSTMR